jgi:hypothetical protein
MSTARGWAKGCGCGCGLAAIASGLLGVVGYFFIAGIVREAKKAEAVMERVREEQGRISDFQPDPDGALRAERVEAFLRARELMAPAREETERALALLSSRGPEGEAEVPGLLGRLLDWGMGAMKIEAASGLIPQAIGFVSARGEALLEAGVGPGEYLYIYSLAYFSWLGKSPADGPSFPLVGDDEGGEGPRYEGRPDEFDVREGRREMILTHLNEQLLPLLRRQLAARDEGDAVLESDAWRRQLAAEIAAMEKDRFRIPWRDGLPKRIETSLRPFRSRLEGSYSPECNPLEVLAGMNE